MIVFSKQLDQYYIVVAFQVVDCNLMFFLVSPDGFGIEYESNKDIAVEDENLNNYVFRQNSDIFLHKLVADDLDLLTRFMEYDFYEASQKILKLLENSSIFNRVLFLNEIHRKKTIDQAQSIGENWVLCPECDEAFEVDPNEGVVKCPNIACRELLNNPYAPKKPIAPKET